VTIQDFGSIGEMVGALATVATLLYLALQVRANTDATRAESRRSAIAAGNLNNASIVENAEVADIFNRGLSDAKALDAVELTRFNFLMGSQLSVIEILYFDVRSGISNREDLEGSLGTAAKLLQTPGGAAYWARHRMTHRSAFRTHMDALLGGSDPASAG